jgi:hypothetical protein
MVRLAKEADADKAPIVRLADKWAAWMVGGAFSIALAAWLATGLVIRAVTVLVVFCPCAFVLATPTAVMAGIACAARSGVLVRSGDALERLARIKFAAFDKTGTLTFGNPQVAALSPVCLSWTRMNCCGWRRSRSSAASIRSAEPLRNITQGAAALPARRRTFRSWPAAAWLRQSQGMRCWPANRDFLRAAGVALPESLRPAGGCIRGAGRDGGLRCRRRHRGGLCRAWRRTAAGGRRDDSAAQGGRCHAAAADRRQ